MPQPTPGHAALPTPKGPRLRLGWVLAALLATHLAPTTAAVASTAPLANERSVYSDPLTPPRFWQTKVWSENALSRTPSTENPQRFRGPFQAQPVTLSLAKLPRHTWVRLRFKLLIIGSWDGSSPVWGPDLWSLHVRGGQRLVFASFGNMGAYVNNNLQSFPDEFPWGRNPAWTGALNKDALNFPKQGGGSTRNQALNDSTYAVDVLFPHSARSLILDFTGIYGDAPKDRQMWGLSGIEVMALLEPPAVATDELPSLWNELAHEDPVRANAALWKMIAAGDRANAFITGKIADLVDEVKANQRGLPPVTGLEALQLHRARRLINILDIQGRTPNSAISHLIPEYFGDPDEPKN